MDATVVVATGLALAMATDNLHADSFGTSGNAFDIEFVTVGDPGNANDSGTTGSYHSDYGGVNYTFRMGVYEVSRDMITKASIAGSLGIDLTDMTSYGGNGVDRPATGTSWNEAARFVNWLNVSTGHQAAYKFALQPGQGGYDANANILLWDSGDSGYDATNPYRNSDAKYFLPSEDEWYKSAYFSGSGTTYYDYATQQDAPSTPTAVASGPTGSVYEQFLATGPADIADAGGLSYYGTKGQGGNVWEWAESAYVSPNDSSSESRSLRGSSWNYIETGLRSWSRPGFDPTFESKDIGFRVASVPEPSAFMLMLVTGWAWLLRRRRS